MSPIYRYKPLSKNATIQHIYVIGEHGVWLENLITLLKDTKYHINICSDIEHTIELCLNQKNSAHTIIIDDATLKHQRLKSLKAAASNEHGDCNFILATQHEHSSAIRQALKRGVFFFITPAYSTEMVMTTLERAMNTEVSLASQLNALDPQSQLSSLVNEARFTIKTPAEAQTIATILGYIAPSPHRVSVGLLELLLNAIEHGNLSIGFLKKSELLASGNLHEYVNQKLCEPAYCDKEVSLSFNKSADKLTYEISDQGQGFFPDAFLEFEPQRSLEKNGRGILIAKRYSFDELSFENGGRTVIASIYTR